MAHTLREVISGCTVDGAETGALWETFDTSEVDDELDESGNPLVTQSKTFVDVMLGSKR